MSRGWVYAQTHPTWTGYLKIGRTRRDPRKRGLQVAAASGLLTPATVVFCLEVEDMEGVEQAVHYRLGNFRVRPDRELFRVSPGLARIVITDASSVRVVRYPTRRAQIARSRTRRRRLLMIEVVAAVAITYAAIILLAASVRI